MGWDDVRWGGWAIGRNGKHSSLSAVLEPLDYRYTSHL